MLYPVPSLPPSLFEALMQKALPWTVEFEGQLINTRRNLVNVPGGSGTEFDIRGLSGGSNFAGLRLSITHELEEGGPGFRFLYSPFRRSGEGRLAQSTNFDGAIFDPGVPTKGVYQFNNYRFTYRNRLKKGPNSDWRFGLTAIVVDAEYSLQQGATSRSFTSIGVVPLFHVYGEERLSDRLALNFDFDGWGVSQGRAYDASVRLFYRTNPKLRLFVGYRLLDGGVNVDSDYNSLLLTAFTAGLQYRF